MRAKLTCLLSTLLLTSGAACATASPVEAPKRAVPPQPHILLDSGEASWYGPRHEGRRTTSGEVFDSHKLTAAHASLPLGSYVRVVVQETGRSIVVKVNDREPSHGVRCIDLSRAAAAKLGIINRGIADVTLEAASKTDVVEELAEAPDSAVPVEVAYHPRHHRRHHHHRPH